MKDEEREQQQQQRQQDAHDAESDYASVTIVVAWLLVLLLIPQRVRYNAELDGITELDGGEGAVVTLQGGKQIRTQVSGSMLWGPWYFWRWAGETWRG